MEDLNKPLLYLSILAVILAGWGFLISDTGLSSTQWTVVAGVLGIWAVYLKK